MISQREARRLKKRVDELEEAIRAQRRRWANWPGGTLLGSIQRERDWLSGRLEGVRALEHAIVCIPMEDGRISFYACPLP